MEKVIASKKKQVNNILELLKDGKISSEGFKSSDQPWFMSEEKLVKIVKPIVLNNLFYYNILLNKYDYYQTNSQY